MNNVGKAALVSLVMVALAVQAHADQTQSFTFVGIKGSTRTATINVQGSSETVYTGIYNGNLGGSAVDIFCTDVRHAITINQTYTTLAMLGEVTAPAAGLLPYAGNYYYSAGPPSPGAAVGAGLASALIGSDYNPSGALSAFDRSKAVAYLSDTYLANPTNASELDRAAAVQIAIWDIITDGGDGLAAGYFKSSAAAFGLFTPQAYITEALGQNPTSTYTRWIQAPRTLAYAHSQDFVYKGGSSVTITELPVPEPAYFQLGALVGMGGLGLLRVRKRTPGAR